MTTYSLSGYASMLSDPVRLEAYEAAVESGNIPASRAFALSAEDQVVREFILQLKLGRVPAAPFQAKFGVDILRFFEQPLLPLEDAGLLVRDAGEVRLTRSGLLRVDRLLPLFYAPPYRGRRYT